MNLFSISKKNGKQIQPLGKRQNPDAAMTDEAESPQFGVQAVVIAFCNIPGFIILLERIKRAFRYLETV
jgi:hypothetical protein